MNNMISLPNLIFPRRRRELCAQLHNKMNSVQLELSRLRGTGIESLDARELAELRAELDEGLRRVRDAVLRRDAEETVASQTNSFLCPIGCELMREPVMAASHTYERVQIEE